MLFGYALTRKHFITILYIFVACVDKALPKFEIQGVRLGQVDGEGWLLVEPEMLFSLHSCEPLLSSLEQAYN